MASWRRTLPSLGGDGRPPDEPLPGFWLRALRQRPPRGTCCTGKGVVGDFLMGFMMYRMVWRTQSHGF